MNPSIQSTKSRLGRGLSDLGISELLGQQNQNNEAHVATATGSAAELPITSLPVERIQPGKAQPRRQMDPESLQELADSIRAQGIIQPIVVRSVDGNRYEIIAGERRWRAAQLAYLDKVPVIIRELSDEAAMAIALIENIQREDLNPIDEAMALKRLIDEFAMTHQEVAEAVGKSRTTITNLLRLLNLASEVKDFIKNGQLETGHAKVLLSLDEVRQKALARQAVDKGLSVRELERLAQRLQTAPNDVKINKPEDPDVVRLETEISELLAATVKINHRANGKGVVQIHYHSLDELEGILSHIR